MPKKMKLKVRFKLFIESCENGNMIINSLIMKRNVINSMAKHKQSNSNPNEITKRDALLMTSNGMSL